MASTTNNNFGRPRKHRDAEVKFGTESDTKARIKARAKALSMTVPDYLNKLIGEDLSRAAKTSKTSAAKADPQQEVLLKAS